MNKTIGILAHVDAGKTTLSEQILHHCGVKTAGGRAGGQNMFHVKKYDGTVLCGDNIV